MHRVLALMGAILLPAVATAACGPDALGTARTLVLKRDAAAYGTVQHSALPLQPGEVVITFDDGPRPESTPRILAALAEQCVKATFFMNGEPMVRHAELAKQVAAQGHTTAMHGYRHEHFALLADDRQLADLQAIQDAFVKTFGYEAPAYRFPFLEETSALMNALSADRVTVMSVDLAIDDWLPDQTPDMLVARMLARLEKSRSGIILMHDAQDQTADALPLLLKELKDNGYSVVHVRWE